MALTIDGKVLRNLEEQVQKNKEDIARHYAIDRALANFGIKIVGTVATPEQLPDPSTYQGEYGDGYAVGQPGSYVYYIFTRPDLNAGYPDNYWLNVGSISIVGPAGPRGEIGSPGPEGRSTRFYASTNYPLEANEGDLYLSPTGMVYEYVNTNWVARVNIRGPEGIQGIQGPVGEIGPAGPVGPRGATGDVGGFINIAGILANVDLLPTPTQIGNLTVAYLVGAASPYDLYIQVGSTSSEAVWTNMGPLNVATYVTVNGQFQNVWDADTKLDVPSNWSGFGLMQYDESTGLVTRGHMYITVPGGGQIPRTDGQGRITTNAPDKDLHCTNKLYVDTLLDGKLNKVTTTGASRMYAINPSGEQATVNYGPTPVANWIPIYEAGQNGALQVGTPLKPIHATNKQYVDNLHKQYQHTLSFSTGEQLVLIMTSVTPIQPIVSDDGTFPQITSEDFQKYTKSVYMKSGSILNYGISVEISNGAKNLSQPLSREAIIFAWRGEANTYSSNNAIRTNSFVSDNVTEIGIR